MAQAGLANKHESSWNGGGNFFREFHNFVKTDHTCGQSYKQFTLVNYDSRFVIYNCKMFKWLATEIKF